MESLTSMNKSWMKGIFFSVVLLFSISLITIIPTAYAEVEVKSFALDETTIMELTNNSDEEVSTLRIWLGSGFNFQSFKTEQGWTGEKTPQGVIVFTSPDPVKPGESVKFGIKTDKISSGINWKALDKENKQIDTSKTLPGELPTIQQSSQLEETKDEIQDDAESMTKESLFRIVPEKPNVGSNIRVTGDDFGPSQEFDFYINSEKIGSFKTDSDGHFMTTMKIPEDQEPERVDFKVKSKEGEERKVSLRIDEVETRIPPSENVKLTIQGIPDIVHRGDLLEVSGTAQPNSAITAKVTTSEGEIINTRTAEVDSKGNWKTEEPVLIPLDTPFGEYSATISDGREEILVSWTVESAKDILMTPVNLKVELGDIMKFNGTALPNIPIELILEDPLGKELASDIIQIGDSGIVEFEYETTQTSTEGTYTLIATQENEKEFIFAGVGQLPTIPVNLEFDKLNYKPGDTAIISLSGKPSDIVSLLIIDPSDKPKGEAISITLQADARATHSLDLDGFASGVYSAVVSKGSTQSAEIFTVGLQTGSGEISINTTKGEYNPGDSILILGDTNENILLTINLIDPDGNVVKTKETFSDKNGKISEDSFRIPSGGEPGSWTINAKSGANFDNIEIKVLGTIYDGIVVSITESPKLDGINDFMNFHIFGAQQTVEIEIIDNNGKTIESLEFPASAQGEVNQPWRIPDDTVPGVYTIRVSDAFNTTETEFTIN